MNKDTDTNRGRISDDDRGSDIDAGRGAKNRCGAVRWLIRETSGNLILIALLFGIAGRWDWWMGWALSAIYIL